MRTNNGAIQVSRGLLESDIWNRPSEWLKIWMYLLCTVNFKDNNLFKRGENFYKYEIIALECNVSINTINKCMKYLSVAEQVHIRRTSRGAIISVVNYDKYQELSNYGRTEAEQKKNKGRTSTNSITEEGNKGIKEEGNDTEIISSEIKNPNEEFFERIENDTDGFIDTMNIPDEQREAAKRELFKFWSYWTEKDLRGKELWRKQKTFEAPRRLTRWLMNNKFTSNQSQYGKKGGRIVG